MFTRPYRRKSIGSGYIVHVPPKNLGCCTMSASDSHPPVDPPVNMRAYGFLMIRNFDSTAGISSFMIASPYGPLFAELTAYESSKNGVGCRKDTTIIPGMAFDTQDL